MIIKDIWRYVKKEMKYKKYLKSKNKFKIDNLLYITTPEYQVRSERDYIEHLTKDRNTFYFRW